MVSSPQHSPPHKLQKKLDEPGRLCTCPAEPNIFGEKIWQSPKLFDLWATSEKKRCFVCEMFLAELLTPHSTCSSEKKFEKKGFFSKKNMFDILSCFWMKKFRICGRSFQQGCQKKSTWPEELFGKTLFGGRYNIMSSDGFSEEYLISKKTQCSSVRHSSCPVEHSKGQISGRNKTFLTFGLWARKL